MMYCNSRPALSLTLPPCSYSRDGAGTRIAVNMGGISSFMSYDPAL